MKIISRSKLFEKKDLRNLVSHLVKIVTYSFSKLTSDHKYLAYWIDLFSSRGPGFRLFLVPVEEPTMGPIRTKPLPISSTLNTNED